MRKNKFHTAHTVAVNQQDKRGDDLNLLTEDKEA